MQGAGATIFNVGGNLTIGETVAIASRLHATYQGTGYTFPPPPRPSISPMWTMPRPTRSPRPIPTTAPPSAGPRYRVILSSMVDPSLRKSFSLKAVIKPTALTLNTNAFSIYTGKGQKLTATLTPGQTPRIP